MMMMRMMMLVPWMFMAGSLFIIGLSTETAKSVRFSTVCLSSPPSGKKAFGFKNPLGS